MLDYPNLSGTKQLASWVHNDQPQVMTGSFGKNNQLKLKVFYKSKFFPQKIFEGPSFSNEHK